MRHNFYHTVFIVGNIELNMLEKKIFVFTRVNFAFLFNLSNETLDWHVIIIHLEVIVFLHCSLEMSDIILR